MGIENNVKEILSELAAGNAFGEPVTLVAATKTRPKEEICRAVAAGIGDVGENRVQEFREKHGCVGGAREHFIGHLQTNKVKYVVGCHLIHSLDRDELAEAIAREAQKKHTVQDVLLQINIGREESKGGYPYEDGLSALARMAAYPSLRVRGFMAMLPLTDDEALLHRLAAAMRTLFDEAKKMSGDIAFLSMGMSGDWRLCLGHGANMIRLGTAIFGERN